MINNQWVGIESPNDVVLEGIDIEITWDGKIVNSIIIKDKKGNKVLFTKNDYSGIRALVPKFEEKWELEGKFLGIQVLETFDTDFDAKMKMTEMVNLDDNAKLKIKKVKV